MKKMMKQKGFTLLEILLVVAIIAVLAGIVILAINPTKQLAESRNAQRRADVNTILSAVYQYTIDNNTIPSSISNTRSEICATGVPSFECTIDSLIDLSVLTINEEYLSSIPLDPIATGRSGTIGTGYEIVQTTNGRITVSAPGAEESATISVTR